MNTWLKGELSRTDMEMLLESLAYSKQAIRDGRDSTYEQRSDKIRRIESVEAKLRAARDQDQ
jgi:hypothetical protein